MNWYDQLNKSQRARACSFLIGYLKGTAESDCRELIVKEYADKLLKTLENYAENILEEDGAR